VPYTCRSRPREADEPHCDRAVCWEAEGSMTESGRTITTAVCRAQGWLRERRIGYGTPQMRLDRELRFDGARVVIFASEYLARNPFTSVLCTARPLYINSTSSGLKMSQCSLRSNDIGYHESATRANPSVLPQVRSGSWAGCWSSLTSRAVRPGQVPASLVWFGEP
jgi:hypothetical protein